MNNQRPRKRFVYLLLLGGLLAFITTISLLLIPLRVTSGIAQQSLPALVSKSNPQNVWHLLAKSDLNIHPPSDQAADVSSENTSTVEGPVQTIQAFQRRPKNIFPEGQIITTDETKPNDKGFFLKVSVLKTDFKYPLIRVAQAWYIDPSKNNDAGSAEFVAESAMVADHFMLTLKEDAPAEDVESFLKAQGAYVRDAHLESNILLIAFDGTDPHSMGRILNAIQQTSWVKSLSPDYLAVTSPN